jgi:ribosomal protein S18 acetylase RimI-like enzyme
MEIRFLDPKDVTAYKILRVFSLEESPFSFSDSPDQEAERTLSDYEQDIIPKGDPLEQFALGAFSTNDELIGFVRFKRDQRSKARHRAYLYTLYVHPDHRRKGIARRLVLELLQQAEQVPGVEQLQLAALISDTTVIPFYEKLGFHILGGLIPNDLVINGRYVDAVYMVKHLRPTSAGSL